MADDCTLEYRAGSAEAVAGIQQVIDLCAVTRPFLDLVEVAAVGIGRVVGFLVGPVVRRRAGVALRPLHAGHTHAALIGFMVDDQSHRALPGRTVKIHHRGRRYIDFPPRP